MPAEVRQVIWYVAKCDECDDMHGSIPDEEWALRMHGLDYEDNEQLSHDAANDHNRRHHGVEA